MGLLNYMYNAATSTNDWDEDGYCDFCGARAIWPPTGEPHYAVCDDNDRHALALKVHLANGNHTSDEKL
jgi:hypothetical protein